MNVKKKDKDYLLQLIDDNTNKEIAKKTIGDIDNIKEGNEIIVSIYHIQIEGPKMKQRTPLKQVNSNIATTKPTKSKSKRKKNDDDDDDDDDDDINEAKGKKNAKLNSMIASVSNNAPATTKFRYIIIINNIIIIIIIIIN